jgi:uncharacterized protein (DUF885 family)
MTELEPHTEAVLGPHLDEFLGELFLRQPVFATAMGEHRFDDRWPDVSVAGLAEFGQWLRSWHPRFVGLDDERLSTDERIDRDLLVEEIDRMLFELEELREEKWDALGYLYLVGAGLFTLIAREFAPLPDRMSSFAGRVEGLPALLESAAANLTGLPGRPVSLLHLETALGQLDGIALLIDEAKAAIRGQLATTPDAALVAALERIEAADPVARAAIERFRRRLEEDIRPRAEGEGRLGGELYARKLRWALRSDLSPANLLARAERDHAAIRAELLRLAREAWASWLGDEAMPKAATVGSETAAELETIRRVLDAVARQHPRVDELLDRCRAETAALERFIT